MTLSAPQDRRARRPLRDLVRPRTVLVLGAAAAVAAGGTGLALRPDGRAAAQPSTVARLALPGSPGNTAFAALAASPPLPAAAASAPRAAVTAYLSALQRGNDKASYALLAPETRSRYVSLAQWTFTLRDIPRPLSFTVSSRAVATTGGVAVPVRLRQTPKLDPIRGFVPARTAATYLAVRRPAGWQIQPDPIDSRAVLPADRGAALAAQAWLTARARCNDLATQAVQVTTRLLGAADLAGAPCTLRSSWRIGAVERLEEGPAARPFTAAYGSGVGYWARLVPIVSSQGTFFAAMAPIGERWRVFGLLAEHTGG